MENNYAVIHYRDALTAPEPADGSESKAIHCLQLSANQIPANVSSESQLLNTEALSQEEQMMTEMLYAI